MSSRSLKSISSKSLSSKSLSSIGSMGHLYDYKKLDDPNYIENLKFKYRNDPIGKKTLLELLRGTYTRNIGDDNPLNGLYYNKKNNDNITYIKSRRSSVSGSRRGSMADSTTRSMNLRRSSLTESSLMKALTTEVSSNLRIPGVDKDPIEEQIDEFARKKGRFLSVDQMKEVVLEEKLKSNMMGSGHKVIATRACMRKVDIVDRKPVDSSRRKQFNRQLEKMNSKYNSTAYDIINI